MIVGFWITEKCLKVLTHLSFSFQVITALRCLCHHSSFCILSTHKCSEQVGTLSPVSLCPRHSQMLQVHNREKQLLSTTRNKPLFESQQALAPASEPRHNSSRAKRFYTAIVETISQQDFHTQFLWAAVQGDTKPGAAVLHTGWPMPSGTHWFHRGVLPNTLYLVLDPPFRKLRKSAFCTVILFKSS